MLEIVDEGVNILHYLDLVIVLITIIAIIISIRDKDCRFTIILFALYLMFLLCIAFSNVFTNNKQHKDELFTREVEVLYLDENMRLLE